MEICLDGDNVKIEWRFVWRCSYCDRNEWENMDGPKNPNWQGVWDFPTWESAIPSGVLPMTEDHV